VEIRQLGKSGLQVPAVCLGAMNFGMPDWGVGEKEGIEIIRAYLDAGGFFLDTADCYAKGASEAVCAQALEGRRDRVILATKGHFPVVDRFGEPPEHVNAAGSSRRHLTAALEASLRRLRTDYVDLYQVHCWDAATPIEETLSTLDGFVKSGKVRYLGLSNFDAWQIAECGQLARQSGWEPFITAQMQYSLVRRDIESAVIPVCRRYGLGVLAWSPLGGGVLSGKYRADGTGPAGSRFGATAESPNAWRKDFVNERNLGIAEGVKAAAARLGTTAAALAVAWVMSRPGVSSVIIGPRTVGQLRENLAACDVRLPEAEASALEEMSRPAPTYPASFIARAMRNAGRG
jgi:aryl-alcohol dehydrogenase-like predicted oxidoreductase